jgi:hypothetical protein
MRAGAAGLRAAVLALCLVALGAAVPALAQDPRASAAHAAARQWLALADKLDGSASYAAAGARFREPLTATAWADALAKARAPLGALVQRTIVETAFDRAAPGGGAEVDIVMILYRTSFANRPTASETVTLELERDGAWRVIGYFIR